MTARVRKFTVLAILLGVAMMGLPLTAAADKPKRKDRPPVEFDTSGTPLQKAIKSAQRDTAGKKKDKPGNPKKDACAAALASNNEEKIADECDVPSIELTLLRNTDLKDNTKNKSVGKRVITRSVIKYKSPKQKGGAADTPKEKWDSPKLKGFERVKDHNPGPVGEAGGGHGGRNRGAAFLPESSNNDDKDCVDAVTKKHFQGPGCFDSTTGKLLGTLTIIPGTDSCSHSDGTVLFGDPLDGIEDACWDENNVLKTSLVELIDEDGPEALDNDGDGTVNEDGPDGINNDNDCIGGDGTIYAGSRCSQPGNWGEDLKPLIDEDGPDSVDNDTDGVANEDPPSTEDNCSALYTKLGMAFDSSTDRDASGNCDAGRALVKFVNDKAMARDDGKGKKVFKADNDGRGKSDEPDGIEPGTEERHLTLTESFAVKCKNETTFVDGVCIADADLAAAGPELRAALALLAVQTNSDGPDISRIAMMGFTFAPPVIEWGYRIDESVCIFGFCVEVFYARIGYEFDLAIGLRLPVEIKVLDMPTEVLAGREFDLETQIEPLDFTSKQYEDFCIQHHLDRDWFIGGGGGMSPCQRYGFTNFLDNEVPSSILSENKKDGDEFVARYSIFAGLIVRLFGITLLNWGIDSSLDIPAACTMMRLRDTLENLTEEVDPEQIAAFVKLLLGFGDPGSLEDEVIRVLDFIKEQGSACGTFTTPFGLEEDGDPNSLRTFPFAASYDIRADCAEALARGEVITIKGKPRPICTNMILGVSGASLGIGLGLEASLGSRSITGDFNTSEDATAPFSGDDVRWTKSANESGSEVRFTIQPDNYDSTPSHDMARIKLDDWVYYLSVLKLTLKATLQFGGILSPIPDIGSFPIYTFLVDVGTDGLPIPQHPGTGAIEINIPVENYGLQVDLKPEPTDPAVRIDDETLRVQPGQFGPYVVRVKNIGSRNGSFDNFRVELSNRPDQTGTLKFGIDRNTDHDCVATGNLCMAASILRGDRWDNSRDECYEASGAVRADRVECIDEDPPSTVEGLSREQRDDDKDGLPDEDPPDLWETSPSSALFGTLNISNVAPYELSSVPPSPSGQSLRLSVNPFKHPLTRPGKYPIQVTGDSVEAKGKTPPMAATDPSGNARRDAKDTAFLEVKSFFEPQVVILPNGDVGKPGVSKDYEVEGTNGGNSPDSLGVTRTFVNFNVGGCTLTTLGRSPVANPDCPFRAVPTVIPETWATVAPSVFPAPSGQLGPLDSATATFSIQPPPDWAGMDDTTYEFVIRTISQADPALPPATRSFVARHKVTATKESMTRYIGLELDELTATLQTAESEGIKLGGLSPIVTKPIKSKHDDALAAIVAGDLNGASKQQSTILNLLQAIVKQLEGGGKNLPPALYADLNNRVAAIIADTTAAQASMIESAP